MKMKKNKAEISLKMCRNESRQNEIKGPVKKKRKKARRKIWMTEKGTRKEKMENIKRSININRKVKQKEKDRF